jgi:hypothetical protein
MDPDSRLIDYDNNYCKAYIIKGKFNVCAFFFFNRHRKEEEFHPDKFKFWGLDKDEQLYGGDNDQSTT